MIVFAPARFDARTFSLIPPTGNTYPRREKQEVKRGKTSTWIQLTFPVNDNSPVIAMLAETRLFKARLPTRKRSRNKKGEHKLKTVGNSTQLPT
jgi:hypothetical protein